MHQVFPYLRNDPNLSQLSGGSLNCSRKSRRQRTFERQAALTPFVGLVGTTYGIFRAFEELDKGGPESTVFAAIFDAMVLGLVCVPISILVMLAWDWLSKK